jgi:hypothetical protein
MGYGAFYFVSLLLLSLASGAHAQDSSALRTVEDRNRKVFEGYEAQLAQIFDSIRRQNSLPELSRIHRRQDLDQLTCTAALNDADPGYHFAADLMYKTSDSVSVTEELKSIARFDRAYSPPTSRYAVAIWPGLDKETGKRTYWVGIHLFPSAFAEFIANTFTDSRPYRNNWKKLVAPACRGIE